MRFSRHSELDGRHAFLSPSTHSWVNYDDQQLEARYHTVRAANRGTALHDLAHKAIELGVLLHTDNDALAFYVEHGIEFGMTCEQPLYYSDNAFGTADTIGFDGVTLRVHDLKTGVTKSKMMQLFLYCALFCLEYGIDPHTIEIECRIYQREDILVDRPNADLIEELMNKYVEFDMRIEKMKEVHSW